MIRKFLRATAFGLLATCLTFVYAGQTQAQIDNQILGTLQELKDGDDVIGIQLKVSGSLDTDAMGVPTNTTQTGAAGRLLGGKWT